MASRQRALRTTTFLAVLVLALASGSCGGGAPSAGGDGEGGGDGTDIDGGALAVPESCNELDDNNDGNVDEGCACERNATQACWPGDPSNRNVGECRDGVQHCVGEEEFVHWSSCEGYVLPTEDVEGNALDENCDGGDGDSCEPTGAEICNDDLDNDCDGDTDCRDAECAEFPLCGDCTPLPEVCSDDVDNDCDGLVDCDDSEDCYDDPWACTCIKQCPPGSVRWCDEPTYCLWGKQTCNPDGTWGACTETPDRPAGCEGDVYYNPICCVLAGQCCQALPSNDSIGTCPPGEVVCEGV